MTACIGVDPMRVNDKEGAQMKVREIMTKDPACCTPETSLSEVAQLMERHDCGQIPVVESGNSRKVLGVVTDRDIAMRAVARGKNTANVTAREVMSSPAITIAPDSRVEECCRTMEDEQLRRLPVVDEQGACCGMVSQADIAQHAPENLTVEMVRSISQPVHMT